MLGNSLPPEAVGDKIYLNLGQGWTGLQKRKPSSDTVKINQPVWARNVKLGIDLYSFKWDVAKNRRKAASLNT